MISISVDTYRPINLVSRLITSVLYNVHPLHYITTYRCHGPCSESRQSKTNYIGFIYIYIYIYVCIYIYIYIYIYRPIYIYI